MYIHAKEKRSPERSTYNGWRYAKKVEASSEAGKRLVKARRAKGMTQVQLAEAIGSSQRAISHYETMAEFPPTAVPVEISKISGVSADYILSLRTPKAAPAQEFQDPKVKGFGRSFTSYKSCLRRTSEL